VKADAPEGSRVREKESSTSLKDRQMIMLPRGKVGGFNTQLARHSQMDAEPGVR
jgi:hypothetical protein